MATEEPTAEGDPVTEASPDESLSAAAGAGGGSGDGDAGAEPVGDEMEGVEVEISTDFPGGWAAIRTPQGEVYYWNQETDQVQWDPPDEVKDAGLVVTDETETTAATVGSVPHAPVVERPELTGKLLRTSESRDLGNILKFMREAPEDARTQDAAMVALKGYTHKSSTNKAAVVSAGGTELVIAAMRRFPTDVLLQESGVIVLRSLARRADLLGKLVHLGATDVSHAARRHFPTNPVIAERTELTVNEVFAKSSKGDKCVVM